MEAEEVLHSGKLRSHGFPEDALPYVGLIRRGYDLGRDVSDLLEEARARFPFHLGLEWLRETLLTRP